MQLREPSTTTLADVVDEWHRFRSRWGGGIHLVETRLEDETPLLVFGDHEIPATDLGIEALARFLGMPVRYVLKVPADEQQWMFAKRIERSAENTTLSVVFTSKGVEEVVDGKKRRFEPREIAEVALREMSEDSVVTDHWLTAADLRLDVIHPEDYAIQVGDGRVRAGLRLGQNRKQNLAPWVQPLLFQEEQTNLFELTDDSFKVDGRGRDADEFLVALGHEALRALERATTESAAYFDLQTQKVGTDPTGVLRRIMREAGLPERTVAALENGLPEVVSVVDEVTMLDFANHVANYANTLGRYSGSVRTIQQAAGSLVSDHAARCAACHRRVDL